MPVRKPLNVVLMWHMHQPEYRNLITGKFCLPWTYLHAIKDYSDMAAHLEAHPGACAVVNFSPLLLDQLQDYSLQLQEYLTHGTALRDPWLNTLADVRFPDAVAARKDFIQQYLHAHELNMIARFETYAYLVELFKAARKDERMLAYLNDQYLRDLVVWFHLVWMGEHLRHSDIRIKRLTDKETGFTQADCRSLLEVIAEVVADIIPRYRALAEKGQVELAMNPYAHPIIPLLLELGSAKEAMPGIELPAVSHYPGGEARACWHIEEGIHTFERHFGFSPQGCWPSEGSISDRAMGMFDKYNFKWVATGENVLKHSIAAQSKSGSVPAKVNCHQGYRLKKQNTAVFFRDDGLSDLIGFTYSGWHADDAVNNLVHHLETIQGEANQGALVSIILDGENAWEHYPHNGYFFLSGLYRQLAKHPDIHLTTFSQYLEKEHAFVQDLTHIVAGSWVYGTFSTWIGMRDKNRAWEMLIDVKICYDDAVAKGRLEGGHLEQATRQLAVCESSDWFWWFGDYNASESVESFEKLFRENLSTLYQILGVEPPHYLSVSFTHGSSSADAGGSMRPGAEG